MFRIAGVSSVAAAAACLAFLIGSAVGVSFVPLNSREKIFSISRCSSSVG